MLSATVAPRARRRCETDESREVRKKIGLVVVIFQRFTLFDLMSER